METTLYDEKLNTQPLQEYFSRRQSVVGKLKEICFPGMWCFAAETGKVYVPAGLQPLQLFGLIEGAIGAGSGNGAEPCYATLDEANKGRNLDMTPHKGYVVVDAKKGCIDDLVGRDGKSLLVPLVPRVSTKTPCAKELSSVVFEDFPEFGDYRSEAMQPRMTSTLLPLALGRFVRIDTKGRFYSEEKKQGDFQATVYETADQAYAAIVSDIARDPQTAPTVVYQVDADMVDAAQRGNLCELLSLSLIHQQTLGIMSTVPGQLKKDGLLDRLGILVNSPSEGAKRMLAEIGKYVQTYVANCKQISAQQESKPDVE